MSDFIQSLSLDNDLAIVVLIFVALAIARDVFEDPLSILKARNVVLAGYFSWYLLEALGVSGFISVRYSQEEYDFAVSMVGLSAIFFLVGYHFFAPWRGIYRIGQRLELLESPDLLWKTTLTAAALGFAPVIYYGGIDLIATIKSFLGLRTTWGGALARQQYGGFRDAMLMAEFFALSLSGLAFVYFLKSDQPLPKRLFALFVVFYALIRAYGTGTRTAMIIAASPVLIALLWQFHPHMRRRMMILTVPLALFLYQFSVAMVVGRGQGQIMWGAETDYVGYEMFRELLFIIRNFPEVYNHIMGESYIAELVNPIPRFLWEGKPARFGVYYAELIAPELAKTGFTVAYGIIGEMWLNFGLFGIPLVSAIGGWLCRTWDELYNGALHSITVMTFFAMGLGGFFVLGRSFSFPVFYQLIFLYIAIWIVTRNFNPGSVRS